MNATDTTGPESEPSPSPRLSRAAAVACAFAMAMRVLLFAFGPATDPTRALDSDSHRNIVLAQNLLSYHEFALREQAGIAWEAIERLREENGTLLAPDAHGLRPESLRPPGYPAFIALVGSICDDIRAVLVLQCALGVLSTLMIISVAEAFGLGRRAAIAVGLLWALHPAVALRDVLILTESLFNTCVIAVLYLVSRSRSMPALLGAGLLLGFAGLVRPLGILLVPAAVALAWPRRGLFAAFLCIGVPAALPPMIWAARNHAVGEGWRVTSLAEVNLLFHTAAYALAEERGLDWEDSYGAFVNEFSDELRKRLEPGEDVIAAAGKLAREVLIAHPTNFLRVEVKSAVKLAVDHSLPNVARVFGRTYQPTGLFDRLVLRHDVNAQPGSLFVMAAALAWTAVNAAIAFAAAVGLVRAWRRRQIALLCGCGISLALLTGASLLAAANIEVYRLPLMSLLFILAASLVPASYERTRTST